MNLWPLGGERRSHLLTFDSFQLTTYQLAQSLAFVAVGGPTWDQNPPFQWSKSDYGPAVPHFGQPDLWQFSPILFNGTGLFPVS